MAWKKAVKPGIITFIVLEVATYILASSFSGCSEPPGSCPTTIERFFMLNYFVIPLIIAIYLIIVLIIYLKEKR